MRASRRHPEGHRTERVGWLRAAVLGANDGIVSTASLVVGVAAASATHANMLVVGVAGLVAGAMSMAAGEYVSVHSQADVEQGDLSREGQELELHWTAEHRELAATYVGRGLEPALAKQVADQLMAHDALGAHARDELGISPTMTARPVQGRQRLVRQPSAAACATACSSKPPLGTPTCSSSARTGGAVSGGCCWGATRSRSFEPRTFPCSSSLLRRSQHRRTGRLESALDAAVESWWPRTSPRTLPPCNRDRSGFSGKRRKMTVEFAVGSLYESPISS